MSRCADCGGINMHFTGCCFIDNQNDILMAEMDKEINKLQSQLDTYKIALKYFTDQSKANLDIVANLLKELEG